MRGAAKCNLHESSISSILLEKEWQNTFFVNAYVIKNSWCNETKGINSNLPYFIILSLALLAIFSSVPVSPCTIYV